MSSPGKKIAFSIIILVAFGVLLSGVLLLLREKGPIFTGILREKVAVIPVEGPILDSKAYVSQISEMRENPQIKAILVRVDSPGGGVGPSQEIYKELLRTRAQKPVVASMGGLAASGGYYVCAGASKIVANPGTVTGSIGVIVEFVRFQRLMEKIGVDMEVIKKGEYKDVGSPHRALTDGEREMLQKVMEDIHGQFVKDVADGRGLDPDLVMRLADGRIFSGREAKELGLVDELGNFQDALNLTKELAKIKGEPELVYPRKKGRLLDFFMEETESIWGRLIYRLQMGLLGLNSGQGLPFLMPAPLGTY